MSNHISVIILGGGKGTRIKSILGETPKLLAPINNKTFLDYMLIWLKNSLREISFDVTIATGCGHLEIEKYCDIHSLDIRLSRERKPLGTLGAASKAASDSSSRDVLILNGDTIFSCSLIDAYNQFLVEKSNPLCIIKSVTNNERYGGYLIDDGYLVPCNIDPDYISMGAVFTKRELLQVSYSECCMKTELCMMDNDFLALSKARPYILLQSTRFIDIGTISSYKESQSVVPFLSQFASD
tara:strand:- start:197 stop:916 length:720 start_codon:yes stop_codon:yes gene_type:complete